MSKPTVYIVRGLPGSGKSTLAKKLVKSRLKMDVEVVHVEADMWFSKDGEYKFDPTKLGEAHDWAKAELKSKVLEGTSVVVSNTFTRRWELDGYLEGLLDMADVIVIKAIGNYQNVHGVPDNAVEAMRGRWEDYPGEVVCDEIFMEEFLN